MSISSTNPSHGMNYAPLNQNEAGSSSSTSSNAPPQNVKPDDIAPTSSPRGTHSAQPQTLEEALLEMEQSSQALLAEMRKDAQARANAPKFIRNSRVQLPDVEQIIRNIDDRAAAQQRARVAPLTRNDAKAFHLPEAMETHGAKVATTLLELVDRKFTEMSEKLTAIDHRVGSVSSRLDLLEGRVGSIEQHHRGVETQIARLHLR